MFDNFSRFLGRDFNGAEKPFRAIDDNGELIPQQMVMPYGTMVARGMIPGHTSMRMFCRNANIGTAANEDLWPGGGLWPMPTVASIYDISSSSANDSAAGTGARNVLVEGITDWADTSFTTEVVSLNGTTAVPTVNQYVYHRLRDIVPPLGSNRTNEGTITSIAQSGGAVGDLIEANVGTTKLGVVAVPSSKLLVISDGSGTVRRPAGISSAQIDLVLMVMINPQNSEMWVDRARLSCGASGSSYIPFRVDHPVVIPGPALIRVEGQNASDDSTIADAWLIGEYIDVV